MNETTDKSCDRPLEGLFAVEAASFVAGPAAGMSLAQMGADVVRVDPPAGGSDAARWPLTPEGASLFWANLNKGKRSVALDYRIPEGHELLVELATRPGEGAGIFLDNMVGRRRVTYEQLVARRDDAIHVHIQGRANGGPAVDYTINAEVGVPQMTGPEDSSRPVNHVVPAWDLVTGMTAVSSLLAALNRRRDTGEGAKVDIALADVALSGVGAMGWLAEAELAQRPRLRHGNHMFGAFGNDFVTSDGRPVMVVALTPGQWRALRDVTETADVFDALEKVLDADLDLETDRYRLRETISAVLRPWFAQRDYETVSALLTQAHVLWSPYRDTLQAAAAARRDPDSVAVEIEQPGIGPMLATGSPVRWHDRRTGPVPAPRLGVDTESVLTSALGLTTAELGVLHARGVIELADGGSPRG